MKKIFIAILLFVSLLCFIPKEYLNVHAECYNHDYSFYTCTWSFDDPANPTAYAVFICSNCSDTQYLQAYVTVESYTASTCYSYGNIKCTAHGSWYGYDLEQSTEYTIPLACHTWMEGNSSWESDYSKCYVQFVCQVCGYGENCFSRSVNIQQIESTCSYSGETIYTPVFSDGDIYYYGMSDPSRFTARVLGTSTKPHDYDVYETWNGDGVNSKELTLNLKCKVCGNTTEQHITQDQFTLVGSQSATCTEGGYNKYCCQANIEGQLRTFEHTYEIPATGHSYVPVTDAGKWVYTFDSLKNGYNIADITLNVECSSCHETKTVKVSGNLINDDQHISVDPTMSEDGLGYYKFNYNGAEVIYDLVIPKDEFVVYSSKWSVKTDKTAEFELTYSDSKYAASRQSYVDGYYTPDSLGIYVSPVIDESNKGDCDNPGKIVYNYSTSYGGKEFTYTYEELTHVKIFNGFIWDTDNSGNVIASASISCSCGQNYLYSANVELTEQINPTCMISGYRIYTASYTLNDEVKTESKTYEDGYDHTYVRIEDKWEGSGSEMHCSVQFMCSKCSKTVTYQVPVEYVYTASTCRKKGSYKYSGSIQLDIEGTMKTYDVSIEVVVECIPHTCESPSFDWQEINGTYYCYAQQLCTSCKTYYSLDVDISNTRVEPTCTASGSVTYTCIAHGEDGKNYTSTKTVSLAALGHDYKTYEGASGSSNARMSYSVTVMCSRCSDFCKTYSIETTCSYTAPTCETDGGYHYVGSTQIQLGPNASYSTYYLDRTITESRLGHISTVSFDWVGIDECTGKFSCSRCGVSTNIACALTSEIITPSTCTIAGSRKYNASFTYGGQTYNDSKTVAEALNPHSYNRLPDEFEYENDIPVKGYINLICSECNISRRLEVNLTHSIISPTCNDEGYNVYQGGITFENEYYNISTRTSIPATGHSYLEPFVRWGFNEEDQVIAFGIFVCSSCNYELAVPCTVTHGESTAKCGVDGTTLYYATLNYNDKTYNFEPEPFISVYEYQNIHIGEKDGELFMYLFCEEHNDYHLCPITYIWDEEYNCSLVCHYIDGEDYELSGESYGNITHYGDCSKPEIVTHYCDIYNTITNNPNKEYTITKEEIIEIDPDNHSPYGTHVEGRVEPTIDSKGFSGNVVCNGCGAILEEGYELDTLTYNPIEFKLNKEGNLILSVNCGVHGIEDLEVSIQWSLEKTMAFVTPCGDSNPIDLQVTSYILTTREADCCHDEIRTIYATIYYGNLQYTISHDVHSQELNPNVHIGETYFVGRVNPSTESGGYSGDVYCSGCKQKISDGYELEKLIYIEGNEESEKQVKNELSNNISSLVDTEGESTPEEKEQLQEAIKNIDTEKLIEISNTVSEVYNEILGDLPEGTTEVEIQGNTLTVEEVKDIISAVTNSAVVIAGSQEETNTKTEEIINNLPEDSGVDLGSAVNDLYEKVMKELLGGNTTGDKNKRSAKGESGIDFSIDSTTYQKAIEFVDTSVDHMASAAKKVRECSNESFKAEINAYITGVSSSSFKNYNKEQADEEFLQLAYIAILTTLQSRTISMMEEQYNKDSKNLSGDALQAYNEKYQSELSIVNVLNSEDETNHDTFEYMIIEIMRLKYVSLLNNKFDNHELDEETYNQEALSCIDVDSFKPKYLSIFRTWCLQTGEENAAGIDLETLSNATIETETDKLQTSYKSNVGSVGEFSNLSNSNKAIILVSISIVLLVSIFGICYKVISNKKKGAIR